jgi:hypothetical protein
VTPELKGQVLIHGLMLVAILMMVIPWWTFKTEAREPTEHGAPGRMK